ncbi:hypothetical protein EYF80_034639 [Liparis tanakae]|uniref:Uncharacterized protein n=1 Tax=Liparis tanakae TaxID=230148 RepID=A0A4Z2GRA1_9TELE|nr:hypothetical protein EYF80_034639 [Liparis tanakae]
MKDGDTNSIGKTQVSSLRAAAALHRGAIRPTAGVGAGQRAAVTDHNTQSGAGLGVAAQSRTQALSHTAATVTCPLDAGLEIIKSATLGELLGMSTPQGPTLQDRLND